MLKADTKPNSTQGKLSLENDETLSERFIAFVKDWLSLPVDLASARISKVSPDVIFILSDLGCPFMSIMIADVHGFSTAEARLKELTLETSTVGTAILTDGSPEHVRILRRRFDRNEFEYIREIEPLDLSASAVSSGLVLKNSRGGDSRQLIPLTDRVEGVFFDIHSFLRDIDGLHADEALDELCKLLYAKLYDEETTKEGDAYKLQRWRYSCTEECAATVRSVYQEASDYDLRVFGMKIPGYNRSRGVFNTAISLSSPALAKAVEVLQSYHLGGSSIDVKGRAFQKVLGPAVRSGMGQYFTPDPIVRLLSHIIEPSVNDLILDPFCGSGHFLTACLQQVRTGHKLEDKVFHEFAFGKLHGIEKSDRMVRIAMTDMRLHGDGHSNIRCTDALLALSNYPDLKPGSFDIILTNPPFGSLLGSESIRQLGQFELANNRSNVPVEILGLERCVQLLRAGGRLGIVLPDGVLANRNSAYVRDWLVRQVKARAIISLPLETFVPFGASIKTSVLVVRKWHPGEDQNGKHRVFLARVDNVGYDGTGRKKDRSDLEDVASAFQEFISTEGW